MHTFAALALVVMLAGFVVAMFLKARQLARGADPIREWPWPGLVRVKRRSVIKDRPYYPSPEDFQAWQDHISAMYGQQHEGPKGDAGGGRCV